MNTFDGSLYLGADSGVAKINSVGVAGSTITEWTATEGQTVFTGINGYVDTADGSYLVSVGGVDQPGSAYTITSANSGTLTLASGAPAGVIVAVRAFVGGTGGGGGSTNATQLQGRAVSSATPNNGQVLAWNATSQAWEPTSINGSVTFNSAGTHTWVVPAWVRWVYVSGSAGNGTAGTDGTNGQAGQTGQSGYYDENNNYVDATTGANGADGVDGVNGLAGASLTVAALSIALAGGTAGVGGLKGYGGGGSGGGAMDGHSAAYGATGNGLYPGTGGQDYQGSAGAGGGGNATAGNGANGGIGDEGGGNGGQGGVGLFYPGFGGGGGYLRSGGGGGGGEYSSTTNQAGAPGQPGQGGIGTLGTVGGAGQTIAQPLNLSNVAGTSISIVIGSGAGSPSITFTY